MKKRIKFLLHKISLIPKKIYCKIHFNNIVKRYCKKLEISKINLKYKRQIKKYWSKYNIRISTIFHRWYSSRNNKFDVRYIPEGLFYDKIEPFFNNLELDKAYTDKSIYKRLFPNVMQPKTILINSNGFFYDADYNFISEEEANRILLSIDAFFIKPTIESGGGKNAQLISQKEAKLDIRFLLNEYKKDFILQEPIKQHKVLSQIHPKSINSIRIMSMLETDGVSIISSVLRMGVGDSNVDNMCSGGLNCGIDNDGCIVGPAYDKMGKIYNKHPQGYQFNNEKIPGYNKIIDIIKREHKMLPHFKLISWDFSIDENGNPILIEFNISWCGINSHQLHKGPLFGDKTDEILEKVFLKK